MPRITKTEIAEAIAARPFDPALAPDSPAAFANLSEPMQKAVVTMLARDFAGGLSGDDCRLRYGGAADGGKSGGVTGPLRRKLFRRFGLDTPATIARSYAQYSDGSPRIGSAHARNFGPNAAERLAEAAKLQAAAEAREAKRAQAAAKRAAKRAATAADAATADAADAADA